MHVVLVVNSFPHLSEAFILQKVIALQGAGLEVSVHAELPPSGPGCVQRGVPVQHTLAGLPRLRGAAAVAVHFLRRLVPAVRCLASALRLYGLTIRGSKAWLRALPLVGSYDVIHFELSGIAIAYADVLPLLRPARLIMSCRGTSEKATPLLNEGRAEKLTAVVPLMDKVHCVSEDMCRTMAAYGLSPNHAFVNRPAVDTEIFRRRTPLPEAERRPFVLLSVGRLHWIKALDLALLAVRQVVAEGWDVRYDILGAGDEESRLRFQTACLGLAGRVRFCGDASREEVRASLEECDLLLLSSMSEGVSNAAIEAMAMEVPVVSTAVGGMGEAIRDGVEGFLVPWGDPGAMAARITELLASPERRHAMGAAGRRRVLEAFTLERQTHLFVAEYRALLSADAGHVERG